VDYRPLQPSTSPTGGILVTAAALAAVVSVFLPWVSFDFGDLFGADLGSVSADGFSGIGFLFLAEAVAALGLGIAAIVVGTRTRRTLGIAASAVGGAMLLTAGFRLLTLDGLSAEFGLYIALAASAIVVVGGTLAVQEGRRLPGSASAVPSAGWAPPPPPPPPSD
jgi:hypothetical protein